MGPMNVSPDPVAGRTVLVTGCCGTVGSELVRQLASGQHGVPARIVGIDNNESEIFYAEERYRDQGDIEFSCCDVRDIDALRSRMGGVETIFHAAALKHVVVCERDPYEAVRTNVEGVQNIIVSAREAGVGLVINMSSDKAVNPTNVMGTSKLMGERLISAANLRSASPVFASTRFGNVVGSRGSVVPLLAGQLRSGKPITITDRRMTRFVMTVSEAAAMVVASARLARGGEVFVSRMPVVRIEDLADAIVQEMSASLGLDPATVERRYIGAKTGEKLFEELMSEEEAGRAREVGGFFVLLPAFLGLYRGVAASHADLRPVSDLVSYRSDTGPFMPVDEIRSLLRRGNAIPHPNPLAASR
jgi:FlaA1/EpsC-like NDP-sugar epimerase